MTKLNYSGISSPPGNRPGIAHLIFLFLLLASPGRSFGQWIGDPDAEEHTRRGIDDVYNLMFDSAQTNFKYLIHKQPDHPAGYFFLAMVDWWRIITDFNNTSHDDGFFGQLDRVIDLCDKRLDKNENDIAALFFKGGALGFKGRLHGNREDWVKAANDGRQALPIVQKAYQLAPENNDILLGMGIYNYYAAVIPEQYPFVKPLMIFFPEGDRKKGFSQLRLASEKALYANVEATYFLMQILENFEKKYEDAVQLAVLLHTKYPNNPMFHRYTGRCYASAGRWNEAHTTFNEILQRVLSHQTGYDSYTEREARFYVGVYEMDNGNYIDALTHFYRVDELSRTIDHKEQSGFMTIANLRMGMIYDAQKKRELAITQYKKVLEMKDNQDAHAQAEQYLKTPYAAK
jgi:tetratricopeptide (TPR) repeat protein